MLRRVIASGRLQAMRFSTSAKNDVVESSSRIPVVKSEAEITDPEEKKVFRAINEHKAKLAKGDLDHLHPDDITFYNPWDFVTRSEADKQLIRQARDLLENRPGLYTKAFESVQANLPADYRFIGKDAAQNLYDLGQAGANQALAMENWHENGFLKEDAAIAQEMAKKLGLKDPIMERNITKSLAVAPSLMYLVYFGLVPLVALIAAIYEAAPKDNMDVFSARDHPVTEDELAAVRNLSTTRVYEVPNNEENAAVLDALIESVSEVVVVSRIPDFLNAIPKRENKEIIANRYVTPRPKIDIIASDDFPYDSSQERFTTPQAIIQSRVISAGRPLRENPMSDPYARMNKSYDEMNDAPGFLSAFVFKSEAPNVLVVAPSKENKDVFTCIVVKGKGAASIIAHPDAKLRELSLLRARFPNDARTEAALREYKAFRESISPQ